MAFLFAFSLQDQVEKYGPYVGLAAFLGLAVLTVLYFAQARELKRLRDWAGRAPERAQELEARVVAQADELRRGPAPEPAAERSGTVGPAQPVAKPAPAAAVPSGNGRGTGTPAPIPPGPRPAVAAAAAAQAAAVATEDKPAADAPPEVAEPPSEPAPEAVPDEVPPVAAGAPSASPAADEAPDAPAAPDAPPAADEPAPAPAAAEAPPTEAHPAPEPEEAPASGGNGVATPPPQIPRATPRPQPRPAPAAPLRSSTSRSATVPPRRPAAPPARRDDGGSSRAARVTLLTLGGIVAVGLVIFGATQLLGGEGEEPESTPNVAQQPTASPSGGGDATASVVDQRPDTTVVVLNGTATDGLAGSLGEQLVEEGYSSEDGMIRTGNNTDQQRQDSVVLFAPGKRRMARDIAEILGINSRPEEIDADTLALANNTGENASGIETDIVVVAGADLAS